MTCLFVVMICWLIFRFVCRFWGRKSINNQSTNIAKIGQKSDAIWMDFGWLLDRFRGWFWAQVGARLAPKSEQWGFQDDVEKSDANQPPTMRRVIAGVRGSRPLKNYQNPPILQYQTTTTRDQRPGTRDHDAPRTTHSYLHKGGGTYVYMYMYIYIYMYMYTYVGVVGWREVGCRRMSPRRVRSAPPLLPKCKKGCAPRSWHDFFVEQVPPE